jgi:hypothetical protein
MGNLIRKRKDLFDALTSIDPEELYTHKMVNYRGKTTDTFEFYTEIIAKHLLNNAEYLEAI